MWPLTGAFDDPRWRRERLLLYVVLPIVLVVLIVLILIFFWKDLFPPPPGSMKLSGELPERSAAVEAVEQAPAPTPIPVASDTDKGLEALRKKDLVAARVFLNSALASNPANAPAHDALAMVELQENHPEKALAGFSEAIRLDPSKAQYFLGRSDVLRDLQRQKEAIADLETARKIDRLNPVYANKVILARLEAGETALVVKELQATIDINVTQSQPDWLAGAAGIELQAGNTGRALEFLDFLRRQTSAGNFELIIDDRFFKPYYDKPGFSRFLPPQP